MTMTATFNVGNSEDFVLHNRGPSIEVWNPDSEEVRFTICPGEEEMVFKPPRPLRNQDTQVILSHIADAMARVEVKDIRVQKIMLPRSAYFTLMTRKRFLTDPGVNVIDPSGLGAKLWGADLVCGTEAKVFSEDMFGVEEKICLINGCPYVFVKQRGEPFWNVPMNERVAMETLRDRITEKDFRKYVKYGFLVVQGASGKSYQIFRQNKHIKVWENGEITTEICVYLKESCPSTDRVIAFKTMVEAEEDELYRMGNVYKIKEAA